MCLVPTWVLTSDHRTSVASVDLADEGRPPVRDLHVRLTTGSPAEARAVAATRTCTPPLCSIAAPRTRMPSQRAPSRRLVPACCRSARRRPYPYVPRTHVGADVRSPDIGSERRSGGRGAPACSRSARSPHDRVARRSARRRGDPHLHAAAVQHRGASYPHAVAARTIAAPRTHVGTVVRNPDIGNERSSAGHEQERRHENHDTWSNPVESG